VNPTITAAHTAIALIFPRIHSSWKIRLNAPEASIARQSVNDFDGDDREIAAASAILASRP
jgi:hypothetical protein